MQCGIISSSGIDKNGIYKCETVIRQLIVGLSGVGFASVGLTSMGSARLKCGICM